MIYFCCNHVPVDSTPPWDMAKDADSEYIVSKRVQTELQKFLRIALSSKPCGMTPLVVNVDDYLGPMHNKVLGELSYKTMLSRLTKWYDTVAVSYAEVVRDVAYANTKDATFFNKKDVHFGYWAHQTIAWTVGFGSLDLISHYCDDEYRLRSMAADDEISEMIIGKDNLDQQQQERQLYLPPPLTEDLKLENVTAEFDEAKAHALAHLKCAGDGNGDGDGTSFDRSPCVVAWISSPGMFNGNNVQRFMNQHMVHNQDWNVETNTGNGGWTNKVGWVATSANATFTLTFKENEMNKDVNTVTIFYMKSYGEKWADSKARFTVIVDDAKKSPNATSDSNDGMTLEAPPLLQKDIWGVHNISYSLSLSEKFILPQTVSKGQSMTMTVDLVSGSTFKIMGMMFCRH